MTRKGSTWCWRHHYRHISISGIRDRWPWNCTVVHCIAYTQDIITKRYGHHFSTRAFYIFYILSLFIVSGLVSCCCKPLLSFTFYVYITCNSTTDLWRLYRQRHLAVLTFDLFTFWHLKSCHVLRVTWSTSPSTFNDYLILSYGNDNRIVLVIDVAVATPFLCYVYDNSLFTPPTRTRQDNWRQDKTVLSCLDPVSNLQLFSLKYVKDYWKLENWKLGRDETKLSCLVCRCVHTTHYTD